MQEEFTLVSKFSGAEKNTQSSNYYTLFALLHKIQANEN
jgi:hypothetical protein